MKDRLTRLRAGGLDEEVTLMGSPSVVRRVLERSDRVQHLSKELAEGRLVESDVEEFLEALAANLRKGTVSPDDVALAALVVALDVAGVDFSRDYIEAIASLQVGEFSLARQVAKECARARSEKV